MSKERESLGSCEMIAQNSSQLTQFQSESAEEKVKALHHFLGKRVAVELRCDNAPELDNAASQLGLVHTSTAPYRKTAVINQKIRTLEDSRRCSIVQAGRVQQLWPLAIQYVSNAMCCQHWTVLHDEGLFGKIFRSHVLCISGQTKGNPN